MTDAMLRVDGLRIGYGGRAILPPVTLTAAPGELWVVAGANGSGKSTLIRTLVGLLPALGGQCQRPDSRHIAYLPQRLHLDAMMPMRAIDLVRLGIDREWSFLRPWRTPEETRRIALAMRDADCAELVREPYQYLSEGQKQRVLLARALAGNPSLLVMDEPTSAMDMAAQRRTLVQLARLRDERGLTILLVSHHLEQALGVADHTLFLDTDFQIAVAGPTPQILADPHFCKRFPGLSEHLSLPPVGSEAHHA